MIAIRRQRGVAVITALLIVALAITISAGIATDVTLEARRTGNLISSDQALQYIKAAERLAVNVLTEDGKDNETDHLQEAWAQIIPPIPIDGGQVIGAITDLNRCMNINSVDPSFAGTSSGGSEPAVSPATAIDRLKLLVSDPAIGFRPEAVDAIVDWIDPDTDTTFPGGAEDGHYLYLDPPYRTANQTFKSVSTLRLVKGFEDPKKFANLLPFICAVDAATTINVNTAPAEVLSSLDSSLDISDVNAIISSRESQPFETLKDFTAVNGISEKLGSEGGLSVSSNYFLLTSRIQIGNARRTFYSVISRTGATTDNARVISRTWNAL